MSLLKCMTETGQLATDVEYGNSHHFYSASKHGKMHCGTTGVESVWRGQLKNTEIRIGDEIVFDELSLSRRLTFELLADSKVFDFVSRFVVYSEDARPGYINNNAYEPECSNLYRQFGVKSGVKVPVGKMGHLEFESLGSNIPTGFDEVFYIRDEPVNEKGFRWIVHHRLIVAPATANLVLRSCNPRFEGPIPFEQWLPRIFKMPFFRIRESKYPNFPIMAVGEKLLSAGLKVSLSTRVNLTDE